MSYIGSTPTTQSFIAGTDYFNGTGSQVAFTLSRSVNSVNDIEVIVNNVEQIPSGYLVSGTTLTFSAAPSAGTSNVYVRYLSTTNLSLAIPAGTSASFNTVTATSLTATDLTVTNLSYTGTLTGGAGVVNLGSGQVYKDASGRLGVGTASPTQQVHVKGSDNKILIESTDYAALQLQSGSVRTFNIQAINDSSGVLRVYDVTADTERLRIRSNGQFVVNNGNDTITDYSTIIQNVFNPCLRLQRFNSDGDILTFWRGSQSGSVSVTSSSTSYNTSSDYRLKDDVQPMTGALARNALLNPVFYKWKVDGSEGEGFVAHELQGPFPGAVTGEKDAVDADGNPVHQGIGTGPLDGHFAACINDLQAIITALTARITALESK